MKDACTIIASINGFCPNSLRNPERLAALADMHLPDSGSEEAFDRLTRLLGVPVSLVDARVTLIWRERGGRSSRRTKRVSAQS